MSEQLVKLSQLASLPNNFFVNGGFNIWQRGNGPFTTNVISADKWLTGLGAGDTISISKDTTHVETGMPACAAVTYTKSTGGTVVREINIDEASGALFAGRTVSVSARVRANAANQVRLFANDGVVTNGSFNTLTAGTTWETITVTKTFSSAPSAMNIGFDFEVSGTIYIGNAMLVVGSAPVVYVPTPIEIEQARCARYYEVLLKTSVVLGSPAQGAGQRSFNPVTFTPKPVTPTITLVGTPSFSNCTGGVLFGPSLNSVTYTLQSSAAGEEFVQFSSSAFITAEANP